MPERIGFIGLGVMGRPMAGHLVARGYHVTVHNRSRAAVDALVAAGAVQLVKQTRSLIPTLSILQPVRETELSEPMRQRSVTG